MAQARPVADRLAGAFTAFEAGDRGAALRAARALLAQHPDLAAGHYLMALIRLDQGQPDAALDHLARAERHGPASPALDWTFARAYAARPATADAALARLARLDTVAAHRLAADLLLARDPAAAAARLAQAVALAPDDAAQWCALGAAAQAAGRLSEAAAALARAVALDPDLARAHGNLAAVALARGEAPAALAHAEQAVRLDPGHAPWRRTLALARQAAGDRAGAEALLRALAAAAPDSAGAQLDLGLALAERDDVAAAAVLARALDLDPGLAAAAFALGEALRRLGHGAPAAEAYGRALALDPEDRLGARLGLALLEGAAPAAAPEAFVRALFDDYAERFDRVLTGALDYSAPALLRAAVDAVRPSGPLAILDLGCGTGLAGLAFAERARVLDGIDLSPRMLDQARGRGLYRRLIEGDVVAAMAGLDEGYDLVLAADVLVYVGDLGPVLAAAARCLAPGGLVAFTVEHGAGGIQLHEGRRFAHGADHVESAVAGAGLRPLSLAAIQARRDRGVPVPGLLVVAGS